MDWHPSRTSAYRCTCHSGVATRVYLHGDIYPFRCRLAEGWFEESQITVDLGITDVYTAYNKGSLC